MTTKDAYLAELKETIRLRCRCGASHVQTVFVHEKTHDNQTVWIGDIEMFDLDGCKEAKRCYAWQSARCGIQIVTVLHSGLVNSAHRAVQAAIISGAQPTFVSLADNPIMFEKRMERAKKALFEAQIKTEDLEAMIQAVRHTGESISAKRE